MAIPVINWLVKNRLSRVHGEDETSRVWNEILHHVYAVGQGYSTGPEIQLNGKADLYTAHLVTDGRAREYKFLVVECKKPGLDTQAAIWRRATDQLNGYFGSLARRNLNRIFGAIAVGRVV